MLLLCYVYVNTCYGVLWRVMECVKTPRVRVYAIVSSVWIVMCGLCVAACCGRVLNVVALVNANCIIMLWVN